MNQSFKKKAIVASLASAFVLVGAGVVSLPGVVTIKAAHANAFAASTLSASTVPVINATTQPATATGTLKINEIGPDGVKAGRVVVTVPSTVNLMAGGTGGSVVAASSLGTSATPVALVQLVGGGLGLSGGAALFSVSTLGDWTTTADASAPGTKVGESYVDSSGNTVITFATSGAGNASTVATVDITGMALKPASASVSGDVNLSFADAAAPYATGMSSGTLKVMTMVTQAASLAGTAATSTVPKIAAGAAAAQPTGVMTFTFVGAANSDNNVITIALDNGAKFHPNAATNLKAVITSSVAQLQSDLRNSTNSSTVVVDSNGKLVLTLGTTNIADQATVAIPVDTAMIDTSAVTAGATITATATGSGTDLTGFTGSTSVATSAAVSVTVAYKDSATDSYASLYAGRTAQATADGITLTEGAPGSMLKDGTVTLALSSGAKFTASDAISDTATTGNADLTNLTTPATAAISATTTVATASTQSSVVKLDSFDFNLSAATAGDLTVTVSGSAGASGSAKIATIINATTTTVSSTPVVTAGSTVSVGNISVTEGKAGAIGAGGVVGFDFGAGSEILLATGASLAGKSTMTNATDLTVKVYDSTGADVTTSAGTITITGGDAANGTTAARELFVKLANASTTGAWTVKITGLKVKTTSTAAAGDLNMVVAGASSAGTSTEDAMDNETGSSWTSLASATKATVKFAQIVSNAVPSIPAATVSGAITAKTVAGSVVAAGNDQGKLGTLYIAAYVPNVGLYLKNAAGSWVTYDAASPASAGTVTLGTHAIDVVSGLNLSGLVGTEVYVGYGVGSTAFGATVPFNNMLSNGTYNLIYTVAQ